MNRFRLKFLIGAFLVIVCVIAFFAVPRIRANEGEVTATPESVTPDVVTPASVMVSAVNSPHAYQVQAMSPVNFTIDTPIVKGQQVDLSFTVGNPTTIPVDNVTLNAVLPQELVLDHIDLPASLPQTASTVTTNSLMFILGTLPPGQSVTLHVATSVNPQIQIPASVTIPIAMNWPSGQTMMSSSVIQITPEMIATIQNGKNTRNMLLLLGIGLAALIVVGVSSRLPLFKDHNRVWMLYTIVLLLGLAGMVITRASIFPEMMFAVTTLYMGAQGFNRIASLRDQLRDLTVPDSLLWATAISFISMSAVFVMMLCAYAFRPANGEQFTAPVMLMFIAGILFCAALYLYNLKPENRFTFVFAPSRINDQPVEQTWRGTHTLITSLGILLLLTEAEISGNSLKLDLFQHVSYTIQGLLFWGGLFLTTWGLCGAPNLGTYTRQLIARVRGRDYRLIALIAVLMLALVLRVWNLEYSLRTSIDDAVNIPQTFTLLQDITDYGLVSSASTYQSTQVYAQLAAISIRLFGYNLAGVRIINAFFGTLGVFALFLLASSLFNWQIGMIAAVLLATFPPHLHFSRITLLHMADAAFGTFALAFLARAMKHNQCSDWVLGGASLGLTQYFFDAGRLFFPPLVVVWLVLLAIFNFKQTRRYWQGLGLFIVAALLVAMPTYYTMLAKNSLFTSRMSDSGVGLDYWKGLLATGNTQAIISQVARPFLVFVHSPEQVWYYSGTHPMILEYLVPIFLLGFFFLLWYWRKPSFVLIVWVVATATANLLLKDSAQYPRFILSFPAIALIMAVGLWYTVHLLFMKIHQSQEQIAESLSHQRMKIIGAAVVIICVGQVVYYFTDHLPTEKRMMWQSANHPDATDAAIRSADFAPGTQIYMISNAAVEPFTPKTFLALYRWNQPQPEVDLQVMSTDQFTQEFIKTLPLNRDYAFFIEPGHLDVLEHLRNVFALNESQYTDQKDMPPNKGFVLYLAPLEHQHLPPQH